MEPIENTPARNELQAWLALPLVGYLIVDNAYVCVSCMPAFALADNYPAVWSDTPTQYTCMLCHQVLAPAENDVQ